MPETKSVPPYTWLVFDVESIPDGELLAATKYKHNDITPQIAIGLAERDAIRQHGNNFIPYSYQMPITIAGLCLDDNLDVVKIICWPATYSHNLGTSSSAELCESVTRMFWKELNDNAPKLISFNGRAFDLPLLELMGFKYGIAAKEYYTAKFGPRHRFSDAHIDLSEFCTNYGAVRQSPSLDTVSKLIGVDGKTTICGGDISTLYRQGRILDIQRYCLEDTVNTYYCFLRTRVLIGEITLERECELRALARAIRPHKTQH